jgi:hypothetical protein
MGALYLSIIGFVINLADTIIFMVEFSQKDKIVYFHGVFFLAFFICGIVAVSNPAYDELMSSLSVLNSVSVDCLSRTYIF